MSVGSLLLCSALLAAPQPTPGPRFRLQSRLVDTQGKPVAGAEVQAVQMAPHCFGEGVAEFSRPVTTGRDGRFTLSGDDFVEAEGTVLLRVSSGTFSAITRLKVVRHGRPVHKVEGCADAPRLEPQRVGTGEVVLPQSAPAGTGWLDVSCSRCQVVVLTGLDAEVTTAKRLERFTSLQVRVELPVGPYLVESAAGSSVVMVAANTTTLLRW